MKNFLSDIMMQAENPDLYEYVLYKKLHGTKSQVKKEEGVPPISFISSGFPLNSYQIFGNLVAGAGVGDKTKNFLILPDSDTIYGVTFTVDPSEGTVTAKGENQYTGQIAFNIRIQEDVYGDFYMSGCPSGGSNSTYNIIAYDRTEGVRCKKWDGTTSSENDNGQGNVEVKIVQGHTTDIQIRIAVNYNPDDVVFYPMIRASTASPYFEPHGYKIPISCAGVTTPIYIGKNPLRKALDDSAFDELSSDGTIVRRVDDAGTPLADPVVETVTCPVIATDEGGNTFDVDTTVTPSNVILYHT